MQSTEGELSFSFDGKNLTAKIGDTIASALWRNGIKVITRSIKFHRPRGLYCGTGDCPNCLANVNGIPNVRTCVTRVENGMQVIPQNKFFSKTFDPITIIDHLYPEGFNYHHRFIRPRFATGIYQRIIRRMTGIGKLPTSQLQTKPTMRLNCDIAVIGDEPAAIRIAELCSEDPKLTIAIFQNGHEASSTNEGLSKKANIKWIDQASTIGAFDDGSIGISQKDRLIICKPKAISICEKGRELPLRFNNWDLPGIIQKSTAVQLLNEDIPLGKNIVIAGDQRHETDFVKILLKKGLKISAILGEVPEEWRTRITDSVRPNWNVETALGRNEIKKIVISNGSTKEILPCDCLITCGPIAPNIELARQLGCEIRTDGKSNPYIAVNKYFETSKKRVFAVGTSTGQMNAKRSLDDATVASKAIILSAQEMRP